MTERSFNILRKVTANWDEIDAFVASVIAADVNGEIDSIVISCSSIKDGVLQDNFTPIISGEKYPSKALEKALSFRNPVDWVRNDMLPKECVFLWSRK